MTVKGLTGTGQYSFINLVKKFKAHDPTAYNSIRSLFLFSHPEADHLFRLSDFAPEAAHLSRHQAILLRTSYIIQTLDGISKAMSGEPMLKPRIIMSMPYVSSAVKEGLKAGWDTDKSKSKEERRAADYACYTCNAISTEKTKLMKCGKCQVVWYCSRKCQERDWKAHKKLCGKTDFDPDRFATVADVSTKRRGQFLGCPTPLPEFPFNEALHSQVWYLSKPDSYHQDYHFDTGFQLTRSLRILDVKKRMIFLVARRRALISRSPPAIYRMLQLLQEQSVESNSHLSLETMIRQLEREYLVPLRPPPTETFESPTLEELSEEWEFLMRRFCMSKVDIFLRTPIPWPRPDFASDPAWMNLK
ncbi:hypothetical protein C8J56DRAFT_367010 [Mycena floridula]|nr:hypothetical protein C8J56DRAFT_367010 [Mycena floridula]